MEQLKTQGNAMFSAKKYREAVALYSQAIQLQPRNAVLYSNRAAAFAQLRWHQRALEDSQKVVELDPTSIKGFWRLGSTHLINRSFPEARAAFSRGLAVDPSNGPLRQGLVAAKFASRYPELSAADAPELLDEASHRLPITRVFDIVRHNLVFAASPELCTELCRTVRPLTAGWVVTGKVKISALGELSAPVSAFDFATVETQIRILCRVSESELIFSYTYNKPEPVDDSTNPALRRMSPSVVLTPTQAAILDVTFAEIKRACAANPSFNPHLLQKLRK